MEAVERNKLGEKADLLEMLSGARAEPKVIKKQCKRWRENQ